jgi:isopentenyl phosphate kinase
MDNEKIIEEEKNNDAVLDTKSNEEKDKIIIKEIVETTSNNLIILKLGGSAITKKSENKFEMNYSVLNRVAEEIKKAKDKKNFGLIVVCGVGPFGHSNVVKYNINNGIESEEQMAGVKETNNACNFVGNEAVNALKRFGLKAKLVQGDKIALQENKKIDSFSTKTYDELLERGIIPVSTGIMVPDLKLVWSVMSGDQIIAQLAQNLRPKKVFIGTDVDGIFTIDPKEFSDAELIPEITKENIKQILEKVGESKSIDVTQGMKGKLEKLAETLNQTPAEIFNLFTEGNLEKLLKEEEIISTKIKL